jgi:hypothetical protein
MECIHSQFVKAKSIYAICNTCNTLLKVTEDNVIPVIRDGKPTYSDLSWQDLYNKMKKESESIKLNKVSSKYITARAELIDYMRHLNNRFKYSDITLYLGVYLMDVIGHNENVVENSNLELIAVACLLLSSKAALI